MKMWNIFIDICPALTRACHRGRRCHRECLSPARLSAPVARSYAGLWYNWRMPNETRQYRAYLCCGPNCTLKRSLQLLALLEREVAHAGLGDRVEVLPGGCMKHCESGPTLTI